MSATHARCNHDRERIDAGALDRRFSRASTVCDRRRHRLAILPELHSTTTMHRRPLAVALACACDPQPEEVELPEPVWEGEHIRFRTESDVEICGGSFAYLDAYVELLEDALDVSVEAPIDYYWIPGPLDGTPCEENIGCYDDGVVYTGLIPHDHELVHAATAELGRTDRAIMEGLAVLYGEDANGDEIPMYAPVELIGRESLPGSAYTSAGHFVHFLVERYDREALRDFWSSTPLGSSAETVEERFAEAFETSFDEAAVDYGEFPVCSRLTYRAKIAECGAPEQPWDADAWEFASDLHCDSSDVVGPTTDLMWRIVTLDVPSAGPHAIEVVADGPALATLARCAGCEGGFAENFFPGPASVRELPAGRYYAKLWRYADDPGQVALRITVQ
jgi:hypothetical protein